jgi:hypothetical protein
LTAPVPSPDLTAIATRVMSNLLGQRWTWPRRRVVDTYRVPYQTRIIRLWGTPVSAVWSVKGPTGQLVEQAEWQLNNGNQIWFLQPQEWWWPGGLYDIAAPPPWFNMSWYGTRQPPGSRDITVDYAYGSPPPPDIDRAINQLAQQFALADACSPNCKLPERVTSVAREGISYTLIDPQDFLTQGRTGLYFVDLVIGSYGGKARSSIMSPELPPPRRISSVVVAS